MSKHRRLIVFFIPPKKVVNGGILSIFSLCKVSREFADIHGAEVAISTYPGSSSYKKNDLFENDEVIYSFDELVKRGTPDSLLMHVPEYASADILQRLDKYDDYLRAIPKLAVNILNQNITLMGDPVDIAQWFTITPHVTQTTAHNRYANQDIADKYCLPTHLMSIYVDPSQYKPLLYAKKENIIALSPDQTPLRKDIASKLQAKLPNFKVITIQNLTYEEYKKFIRTAKFTVTFGEGFDNYYFESFFTGGITFAVYNDAFFPDNSFLNFENTYASYEDMLDRIVDDIVRLDNAEAYQQVVKKNTEVLSRFYSFSRYTNNVKDFYLGKYSYTPSEDSAPKLIGKVYDVNQQLVAKKNSELKNAEKTIEAKDQHITAQDMLLEEKDQAINRLLNSTSWRITKPVRALSSKLRPNVKD